MRLRTHWLPLVGGVMMILLVAAARSAPSLPVLPPGTDSASQPAPASSLPLGTAGRSAQSGDFRLVENASQLTQSPIEAPGFELFSRDSAGHARRQLLANLPYGEVIEETAARHDVDPLLLAAVVEVESGFDARAVSPRGAVGLAQIMPITGEHLDAENLHEPAANLEAGARYLRLLQDQYDGDVGLILAAYNAGPGNVARFGGVPPFRETRRFISRVLGIYVRHQDELREPLPPAGLDRVALR